VSNQEIIDHDCAKESGVTFDCEEAKKLDFDTYQIRTRWPRKQCPICRAICYASYEHYIAGDW